MTIPGDVESTAYFRWTMLSGWLLGTVWIWLDAATGLMVAPGAAAALSLPSDEP